MGLRLLEEITQAIHESPDLTAALQVVLRKVCETAGCSYGEVWIPGHDNAVLECQANCCGKSELLETFQKATRRLVFQPGAGTLVEVRVPLGRSNP